MKKILSLGIALLLALLLIRPAAAEELTHTVARGDTMWRIAVRYQVGLSELIGANPQILIDAHPHIGTDRLPKIVENIRQTIESKGGEYHFGTKVTDITSKKDGTIEVKALDSEHPTKTTGKPKSVKYIAKKVILATGHSARDIYEMLLAVGRGYYLREPAVCLAERFAFGEQ